jgi:hypothetical protein
MQKGYEIDELVLLPECIAMRGWIRPTVPIGYGDESQNWILG